MSTQSTLPFDDRGVNTTTPGFSQEDIARLNASAVEVDIASIVVGDRVRRDFSHVPKLAESIKEDGLIQPIVLTYDRKLIAGESRIRACKLLGYTTIRAVFRGVLDEAQLHILEVTENNIRQNLTWQERCLSIDRVHRYHTVEATARGQMWGTRETGELLNQGKSQPALAVLVAGYLHANDKEVWAADSLADAYRCICKQREEAALRLIVADATRKGQVTKTTNEWGGPKLTEVPSTDFFTSPAQPFTPGVSDLEITEEVPGAVAADLKSVPLSSMLLFEKGGGNSLEQLLLLGTGCTDHIITDPPYAISMDNLDQENSEKRIKNIDTVEKEHDVDSNLTLLTDFIIAAFPALRNKGFLIMWCDPTYWWRLCEECKTVGFAVQRWPLVWHKTSNCINQASQYNFTKNIEFAVVARKGSATLLRQMPSSVWTGGNDLETKLLGHPFAKPTGLWEWLYGATCQRGAEVLDPFVGCGSSTLPAIRAGLRPRGIECNAEHYGRLLVNVQNLYKSIDSTITFT